MEDMLKEARWLYDNLLEKHQKYVVVIDDGNKGKGDELVAYLKKQKVDDIEMLISTRSDADNI